MSIKMPGIDVFEKAALEAVSKTFGMMIPGTLTSSCQKVKKVPVGSDISGMMLFLDDQRAGLTFILGFPKATIFEILKRIYGREFTDINDSVQQGVGEITNIAYGQMRTIVNESGYRISMTLPSIVMGAQHHIHTQHSEALAFDFKIDNMPFTVFIGLGEVKP